DSTLVFRLLAVADGYVPARTPKAVDPQKGPVTFALRPHDLDRRDPALVLRGRVLDEDGKPVSRAVVEPFGFQKGQSGQFGGLKGFDELALTDEKGDFRLGIPEPGLEVYVLVSAPLRARRVFQKLATGPQAHNLTLLQGVTVTGRLCKG